MCALVGMRAVGLDFETTGLDDGAAIIQIGAASCILDEPRGQWRTFGQLVHCAEKLSEDVKKLTGLDDAKLENAPAFPTAWASFSSWLERVSGDGNPIVFVTHNGFGFDFRILVKHLAKHNTNVQRWLRTHRVIAHVDFLSIAKDTLVYKQYKLSHVYRRLFGKDFDNAHDAEADAVAVLQAYMAFREGNRGSPQERLHLGMYSIEHTLLLMAKKGKKSTALVEPHKLVEDPPERYTERFKVNGVTVEYGTRSPLPGLYKRHKRKSSAQLDNKEPPAKKQKEEM